MKIIGIIFIVAGIALRYWVNKRRFDRRAITGLEMFSSYGKARLTVFLERLIKLLGLLLIAGGGILVLLSMMSPYGLHTHGR